MSFVDEAKIFVKAGCGGNGSPSFRREKFIEFGGPDGGDGGRGGNIILKTSSDINTLMQFKFNPHIKAENGKNGQKQLRYGASAKDVIKLVPVGVQIYDQNNNLIKDLDVPNVSFIVAKGGKGGLGNNHFKTSVNRAPRKFTYGGIGEEKTLMLRLKILADIGIIGFPNIGKSTFLSLFSNAKPKIGNYSFTTLEPKLGTVVLEKEIFTMADIPGLIEGASDGLGLGDKFLKHIERSKILLHLVDASSTNVERDYLAIRKELKSYSALLAQKKEIVLLSRCDLVTSKEVEVKKRNLETLINSSVLTFAITQKNNMNSIKNFLNNELKIYE